ncbi:Uncharacterised protein [Bordetella pertussis]|nr:Uncharacterised protein [Bordetella pertussis]CFO64853.1 Uncharacterised protein [Bordetella pertussis]CFU79237.1 Uncharacterised protein [Bordetella pertussis]CPH70074.1 Uncharacterised protein [Bordetella pertussis]CPK65806.1 Uncharacterised protein [Bordetella pertussis]
MTLTVTSALEVSFMATTVLVAGSAMAMTMRKGMTVHATSTPRCSWKVAALCPRDFRCAQIE